MTMSGKTAKGAMAPKKMASAPAAKRPADPKPRASRAGLYSVPPVIGKGRLSQRQIQRAVATALRGKTFSADVD